MSIIPIILCGGKGARLKPFLKSQSIPKQFLNILDVDKNLLQNTVSRFEKSNLFDKPVVVGGLEHQQSIERSLSSPHTLILEPDGRNTGPAISAAVAYLQESGHRDNDIIIALPIDHYIRNTQIFLQRLEEVTEMVKTDPSKIVTFCSKRTSFEKNYGHIKQGKKVSGFKNFFYVEDFIEKPSYEILDVVWNCGIYTMSIYAFKQLLDRNSSNTWVLSRDSVIKSAVSNSNNKCRIVLNSESFSKNTAVSFDEILTRAYKQDSLVCAEIGTHWEDVGIWSGIKRLSSSAQKAINRELFVEKEE